MWLLFLNAPFKVWLLMIHFQLWIGLWATQPILPDTCKHFYHNSILAVKWQRAPSQVWAGLSCFIFFVFFLFWMQHGVLQGFQPPQKLLHKSHSCLNSSWWAVLTLKPGNKQSFAYIFPKKSVIQTAVNILCHFFFLFFCDCKFKVVVFSVCRTFLLTEACCGFKLLNSSSITLCCSTAKIENRGSRGCRPLPQGCINIGSCSFRC